MAILTHYHWLAESRGGKYTFPSHEPSHIGTYDCQTCVGVYFAFEDNSCFCAHINPYILTLGSNFSHVPQFSEGEKLQQLIVELLKRFCGSAASLKKGRDVIVVCPEMYADQWGQDSRKWRKLVGWFVVEGIREWVEEDQEDCKRVVFDGEAQGFVVDHWSGEVAMISKRCSVEEVGGGVVAGRWFVVPEERSLGGRIWEPFVERGGG
ncbi:uncharacterized protein RCC_07391 [Ramularia collo-cygni]|uniref:Uncharacterized protein n=1 Tax=Ramularia collo-cygni TaxID=112498 RepID=A0A2D3V159_9PEZI|nr:uncharacterized protein RCC_07391 [Ramularia collo-cygni]CZT21528.1 uncharacterized protein RCC_07391 [Ramularia collo-cygni]